MQWDVIFMVPSSFLCLVGQIYGESVKQFLILHPLHCDTFHNCLCLSYLRDIWISKDLPSFLLLTSPALLFFFSFSKFWNILLLNALWAKIARNIMNTNFMFYANSSRSMLYSLLWNTRYEKICYALLQEYERTMSNLTSWICLNYTKWLIKKALIL